MCCMAAVPEAAPPAIVRLITNSTAHNLLAAPDPTERVAQ
jgi:hypothetical protein